MLPNEYVDNLGFCKTLNPGFCKFSLLNISDITLDPNKCVVKDTHNCENLPAGSCLEPDTYFCIDIISDIS
jgi:hypothetical protein